MHAATLRGNQGGLGSPPQAARTAGSANIAAASMHQSRVADHPARPLHSHERPCAHGGWPPGVQGSSAFRVVRRGYDPEEVDAYFSQPAARLKEAVDQYAAGERARAELQGEVIERAQQQAEQLRAEVTAEAQRVLEQAREVAEQIRAEVEAERAAVVRETDQVRAFRDGLLDDLGRVHGEISGLLERTRKQQDQALGAGAADPKAEAAQNGNAKKPTEPTKAAEGE